MKLDRLLMAIIGATLGSLVAVWWVRKNGFPALPARVREVQGGNADTPVVISADKAVKYEAVVKVMDTLQRAGVQRVGLSVKSGGS